MLIKTLIRKFFNIPKKIKSLCTKPIPSYHGVFEDFNEVPDENPWITDSWVEINRNKLYELPIERYSEVGKGYIPEQSHLILPSLIINNIGGGRILDFGGGTGFSYFGISGFINDLSQVRWKVFDPNTRLYELGREYVRRRDIYSAKSGIEFLDSLPEDGVDIVHISSSLQYVDDVYGLLRQLAWKYRPAYFIFTRTLAGDIFPFVTRQIVHGKSTPCRFLNASELKTTMTSYAYQEILSSPGGSIDSSQFEGIPEAQRINRALDMIYRRVSD